MLGFHAYDRNKYGRDPAKPPSLVYEDAREVFGLHLYLLLDPEESKDGLGFSAIAVPPSCLERNRRLLTKRLRVEFACPQEYHPDVVPCFRCEQGRDACPAACHARTYEMRACPKCERSHAPYEVGVAAEACVDCSWRVL
jgi:hypothetical protein